MPDIFYILLRRLRKPLILLIVVYAVSILGFWLIPGQDDQGNVWYMSFFHAFYFVSYMASTIGFGEIPYAFSDAQRLWAMFTIYATVIGWLYSIGMLLSVLQDPAFRQLRNEYAFRRRVQRLRTPFYLVCGSGDTGAILIHALAEEGIRSVVIDQDEAAISRLELQDFAYHPPAIIGDASRPTMLEAGGVTSPYCLGVIALTYSDQVNLLIALATHLLNPEIRFLARADSDEAVANISSFGDNIAINPFEIFAGRLMLALQHPGHYTLFEWITGVPHETLMEPTFPQPGRWLICGYGRLGRILYERFSNIGIEATIVEPELPLKNWPQQFVRGGGTDTETLCLAGIHEATGIVAATDNDGNNLSILMTARELNPDIFMVARQNNRENAPIFDKARCHLTMKRGDVVAHKIFALLRTPLIGEFLDLAAECDESWANQLLSRILAVTDDNVPYLWELKIAKNRTPALYQVCKPGSAFTVPLYTLLRKPSDREQRLAVIPLLLKRQGAALLVPEDEVELQVSDRILMCATRKVRREMEWATQNEKVLHYLLTGHDGQSHSMVWRWLTRTGATTR
ncbi:MAG: potassium transporter TrkA [Thiothrix nivea]|nr:MAG: potassium transporter TrkA [Thiothrix nivea]